MGRETPRPLSPIDNVSAMKRFLTTCARVCLLPLVLTACTSKETKTLLAPSQTLGAVLAEETARAAGSNKQVVLILPHWAPTTTAGESFKEALKKQGLTLAATLTADVGDPMRRGPIGLKSADFFAALDKAAGGGVVVSLAGAPLLQPGEATRLGAAHPPVLVVTTASLGEVMGVTCDRPQLANLLEARIIQLAIVDAASESAPAPAGKTDAAHQSFSEHYLILRCPQ
jgi:hypothetical protein